MECSTYREQMAEYFTGTLEAHRAKALEEHVSTCEGCSHEFADFKHMMEAVAEPIEVPAAFRDELRRAVSKEAKRRLPTAPSFAHIFKNPFFKVLIGATAAALLLLAAGLVWFDLILPKETPVTVVSYVEDQSAGMERVIQRGLSQLVPPDSATGAAKLLLRYDETIAGQMDEKAVSIGGEVLNSANRSQPCALYAFSPDVLSFFINYLKTLGPVEASLPRIGSITSDKVYVIIELGK